MPRWPVFLVAFLAGSLAPAGTSSVPAMAAPQPSVSSAFAEDLPIEKRLQRAARDALRGVRRAVRKSFFIQKYGPAWWWKLIRRSIPPVFFAILVLLADLRLFLTWKEDGLVMFATYALLTVYVYARLLLSSEVRIGLRLVVLASLVYGIWPGDLIPDRFLTQIIPCRIDDFLFIAVAVRLFVYGCPQEAVERFAGRAMARLRRVRAAYRGRGPQTV
jgi:uncharacterized membrane protein YkvA (DUF1232 family)